MVDCTQGVQTPFMERQQKNRFTEMKFVDIFPKTKTSKPEDFVFFVSRKDEFGFMSNWHLEYNGHYGEGNILFRTAEHHLMWKKASVFNDEKSMSKILELKPLGPRKNLGEKFPLWKKKFGSSNDTKPYTKLFLTNFTSPRD